MLQIGSATAHFFSNLRAMTASNVYATNALLTATAASSFYSPFRGWHSLSLSVSILNGGDGKGPAASCSETLAETFG